MNLQPSTVEEIRAQLNRIEQSCARTERAVFGEAASGLDGLVSDVKDLKLYRDRQLRMAALVGGGAAGGMMGLKALVLKVWNP